MIRLEPQQVGKMRRVVARLRTRMLGVERNRYPAADAVAAAISLAATYAPGPVGALLRPVEETLHAGDLLTMSQRLRFADRARES